MFDAKHASRATRAVHVGLDKEHMDPPDNASLLALGTGAGPNG